MKHNHKVLFTIAIYLLPLFPSIQGAFTNLRSSSRIHAMSSFQQVNSGFLGRALTFQPVSAKIQRDTRTGKKGTELGMFLGSDGGILGVGAPEVATILLVGYFVLGPTELFKLTKEIGKFIQNIRTLGSEATKSFESTMENQLELQELRKAQSELNNAFSFRRSINVDPNSEAFSEIPPIALQREEGVNVDTDGKASVSSETVPAPKRKKRRRVKKKVAEEDFKLDANVGGEIPDLDMSAAFQDEFMEGMGVSSKEDVTTKESEAEMAARLRRERIERLEAAQARAEASNMPSSSSEWYSATESDIASKVLAQQQQQPTTTEEAAAAAQSRFEAQLSGKWNQQVLANEEKLSPLAQVMERIAVLEEERIAANIRLDEEFARRAEIEERFYREKRAALEQAASQISAEAYGNFSFGENDTISSTTTQSTTVTETSQAKAPTTVNSEGVTLNGMKDTN